jgi:DNA repair protein RadA/Sms
MVNVQLVVLTTLWKSRLLNNPQWMSLVVGGVSGWQAGQNGKPGVKTPKARASLTFDQISDRQVMRWESGYGELDRVLGGGIVPGSMVLIGGDPGIGKSTLLLQVSNALAERYRILYISGEESGQQIKLRASRLGVSKETSELGEENGKVVLVEETPQPKNSESIGADLYVLQKQI